MRNEECVCGHLPPEFPNPDCERCGLVARVAELEAERDGLRHSLKATMEPGFATVTTQQMLDCGINGFAAMLLAESFRLHPKPKPVKFAVKGVWVSLTMAAEPDPKGDT